jgi:hypothetical protein
MPLYYFLIEFADRQHGDDEGTWLPDDAAAQGHALRIIRELKEGGGYDDTGLVMIVRDESGREVLRVSFAEGVH